MSNEALTCHKYVIPRLTDAGWERDPHAIVPQYYFTDGEIRVVGRRARRGQRKFADYLLRYTPDFPIAVVEAKADYKHPADGLQQAKEYASILGLAFAYATNGQGIVEFDYLTGLERPVATFPTPDELWGRLADHHGLDDTVKRQLLTDGGSPGGKRPRYYQQIAINRAIQAILRGQRRVLLTMATGTGKTFIAFQICWRLWQAGWNRAGTYRKPRMLYLADRAKLVDDPKDKDFRPFGDARHKLEGGLALKTREMYFATYQAIAQDEARPGLYREFPPDFFDLILVDECHRGSARDDSNWREILTYFEPAYQLGMTATPRRDDNADTYDYFGPPVYQYSLKQGIEDGFLAPYRVHRILTTADAYGWSPQPGELDRYGRAIPEGEYTTADFERVVALRARTEAIARHLTDFLKQGDRFAKTIVFCVDQEHALEMRQALTNLNADLTVQHPDYVVRVTSDEGERGMGFLDKFQDPENRIPAIVTTSKLLTTGVDIPTCRNVVLVRVIHSMTEFKQIIGRGTRVRDDHDKLYFNILDYTGSATKLFRDPDFDGFPPYEREVVIDAEGVALPGTEQVVTQTPDGAPLPPDPTADDAWLDDGWLDETDAAETAEDTPKRRKYYYDGGEQRIEAEARYIRDPQTGYLRPVSLTDYTGDRVRTLYRSLAELHELWLDPDRRDRIIARLEEEGISLDEVAASAGQPDADPFDLLCHLAFDAPLRTRRQRADRLRREQAAFFERYNPPARLILNEMLDKYAEHGPSQLTLAVLDVPPLSRHGNILEISRLFGGEEQLVTAVERLQDLLYAA